MKDHERDLIIRKNLSEVFTKASHNDLLQLFHDLRTAYGERHRAYHTLTHIAEMLREAENHPLDERRAIKAAILYHDFVYKTGNQDGGLSNEEASAQACGKIMSGRGIGAPIVERAMELIRMTETHDAPEDDYEAALLMDIDMSVLGSTPTRYMRYAYGIAREYVPAIGEENYIHHRSMFLRSLIDGKPVFKTQEYSALEESVRENAERELGVLRHIARSMAPDDRIAPQML